MGLPGMFSLSPLVSPSRALVLSYAHYFQAPATQASVKWPIERDVAAMDVSTNMIEVC